jgi:hypothetical protein
MKSIKEMSITKYFEFKKPNYIFLKLTPSTSIRNYNSDQILKLIGSLYRSFSQQIKIINNKLFFECTAKVSFYTYMEKNNVMFYFIVPEAHYTLFKDKIIDTWSNKITITIVPQIPMFNQDCTKYYLTYKKEDAMSLITDKRNNTLLTSELSTLYVMEDGDKAGVFFNFIPTCQTGWKKKYEDTINKINDGMPINKKKVSLAYVGMVALELTIRTLGIILESISFGTEKKKHEVDIIYTDDTRNKKHSTIIDTQIICFSESKDKLREYNTGFSLCQSFQCLSGDNELVSHKIHSKSINLLDTKIKNADTIKIQPREGQNFISLPGLELLEEHKIIDHLDVAETEIHKELQSGVICLGNNTYKDKVVKAYLPTGKNERNLTLVIIGPTRSGKSTLISNISNDARTGGECTILFDFCGNCELSDSVNKDIKNVLNIDCSNLDNLQGMGYNEVNQKEVNPSKKYENSKIQATQLLTLIDAVNDDDRDLKAKMNKYLTASALVVFTSNGSIKDVFTVLQNHKLRNEYILSIPKTQYINLEEYIDTLHELDETKNGEIIGTKYNTAIGGIMDRLGKLKQNTYMELMLKKDCNKNINLIDEIQKNQIICFRMPEHMFSTESEKDAYCTYWMTKIWLAVKLRYSSIPKDQHVKLNVIIDELSQVPHCQDFVRSKLSQMAKFNCKMIISCHFLNQIKLIREELKSANSSYMLFSGCNKDNFKELKEELEPFTVEDLLRLKKHHSLNL